MAVKARVSVEPVRSDTSAAVRRAMDAAGIRDRVRSDDTVFVKPNYTFPRPVPGVTTDAEVLEAVLATLTSRARRVIVGESDGGYGSFTAERSLQAHGLHEICKRTGAEALDLSADDPVVVEDTILGRKVSVKLAKSVYGKADVSVSVPVMKAHAVHRISLGSKNLWGCDTDTMRLLRRKYLSRRLALIARSLNVNFVVIDATTALDRYGPMQGDPVRLDTIIAGDSLAGTDAAGARLMGYDPAKLELIRTMHRAGLGPIAADEIDLLHAGPAVLRRFRLERRWKDYLAIATFHNTTLAKVVYDSPLTPVIYGILGKKPKRRLE